MTLSTRERIIAVATVTVLALLALDRTILTPWLDRLDAAQGVLAQQQQQLQRAEQTFNNRTRAQRKWRSLTGETLQADASTAESQVLNHVRDWASAAGLSLTALKPERSEKDAAFVKIIIRATATGSMKQMARFLHSAQTTELPLRITDLQLSSRKEGTDDLALTVGLATIFQPRDAPKSAGEVTP